MENGPFIDDFPINTSIYKRFSMAMLNNQMVSQISTFDDFLLPNPLNLAGRTGPPGSAITWPSTSSSTT